MILSKPPTYWSWLGLSLNPCITTDIIESFISQWQWFYLSTNPNLNVQFVRKYINKNWDWFNLSCNPCMTFNDVISNPGMPWNWRAFSMNPNVTTDIIEANQYIEWDYLGMNYNPNLTPEFKIKYAHKNPKWAIRSFEEMSGEALSVMTFNYKERKIAEIIATLCENWLFKPPNSVRVRLDIAFLGL